MINMNEIPHLQCSFGSFIHVLNKYLLNDDADNSCLGGQWEYVVEGKGQALCQVCYMQYLI